MGATVTDMPSNALNRHGKEKAWLKLVFNHYDHIDRVSNEVLLTP